MHWFFPLFEPTENLSLHYQTTPMMKQAQRHWEIKAGYHFSPAPAFPLSSQSTDFAQLHPECKECSTRLTMLNCLTPFPRICKVLGWSRGKSPFLRTAQKHGIFPSAILSVLSIAGRQRWMKALSLHLSRFSQWLGFPYNRLLIDAIVFDQADQCFSLLWFQHCKELQNQTWKY